MTLPKGVKIGRPDPARLRYAFWQYGCVVFCDQEEKFGVTREAAAEWYRRMCPPPERPWLADAPASTETEAGS